MVRIINPLFVNNFIDANIFDDVAGGHDSAVNEIVRMAEEGEIVVLLPYSVQKELADPNTPDSVRRAGTLFPFSMKVELTADEQRGYEELIKRAKGEAEERNIRRDLFHVFEAAKYGGYFITKDKRLLARASVVASYVQVDIVTPERFLERVQEARHANS